MSWYISSKIGKWVERPPRFTLLQAMKSSQTHNEDVHIAPISSSAFCRILATAKRYLPRRRVQIGESLDKYCLWNSLGYKVQGTRYTLELQ